MKLAVVVAVLACVAAANAVPTKTLRFAHDILGLESIANDINARNVGWKAGVNERFVNVTMDYIRKQMGTRLEGSPVTLDVKHVEVPADLPTSFDSRTQWGSMCPSVKEVRDQANCGSCWAFGAVEAMTDRTCIASKGAQTPHISAEDLLTCCTFTCGDGCNGGYPAAAWEYWKNQGIVTGGQYDSNQGCQPYSLAKCEHHTTGPYKPCGDIVPTPACKRSCRQGYNVTYPNDKHFGASSYGVRGVDQIATEIMTNGPVEAAFTVYSDFLSYKSGVYQHTSGQPLGGHAIKIIGWGVQDGTDYWIVANSWNDSWGNDGFFWIKKGTDECGIESQVVAGLPKV
ncbi:cathepsin B [Salpingoeca rosetta]|uniref:Cathepsin B n=1 Tax=Salpingoeca rosetta (strain ATCC 50818 / BSB-021) TaxID=946362 RepID=F2UAR2_SALR5|nr:cathepsin B [Salpingoeca rosetta]EGD73478.1 cathepsin B [Salpingoeca rosetta]|eukprot:XP_004993760.1 cathepsin B [Salpingoeca rosetta]